MTKEQHERLSSIVGCGSDEGFAEVDQVEDAYERLRAYEVIMQHYHEGHSLPDICCPDLEAALDILRKRREANRPRTARKVR